MELIDRYVYAVVHRLPAGQQADIEKELRGLIEDMLEERAQGAEPSRQDVEAVLTELGKPAELAASYRGTKRYLIGPDLFDPYLIVLRIVGIAILIGISIVFVIQSLADSKDVVEFIAEYISTVVAAVIQGFAWVTAIFAIMEYSGFKKEQLNLEHQKGWTPADLPAVPSEKARIPLSEPIAGIIFSAIFMILFIAAADWIGSPIWINGSHVQINVFDKEVLSGYLPWIIAAFALGIMKEAAKLISRRWTVSLIAAHLAVSVFSLAVAIVMFSDASIWNPGFMNEWVEAGVMTEGSEGYRAVNTIWTGAQKWASLWIAVGFAIDLVATLWKFRSVR